jgi:membrane protein CcdC involved in cytochrome C biogenesis
MSTTSIPESPKGASGGSSSLGVIAGVVCLALAAIGLIGPVIGLPIGLAPAVAAGFGVAGIAFLIGSLVDLKAPQDFAGGMFIIVIATIGIVASMTLNFKTSTGVGPGMMPRSTGFILVAMGLILVVNSFISKGAKLDAWSIRGMIFVLGSALIFGWTIRPLGLIVAGPLAVMVSAFADRETRWIEVMIFAAVMTLACIGLFSYGLKLPIPIWPSQTPHIPGIDPIKFDLFKLFG